MEAKAIKMDIPVHVEFWEWEGKLVEEYGEAEIQKITAEINRRSVDAIAAEFSVPPSQE